jgi:DNA invertase Pin-like site-specific DNA recombinase
VSDILGYARVSTQQQDLDSQKARLTKAGAIRIFEDVISGKIF